jgi:hypothetical protein
MVLNNGAVDNGPPPSMMLSLCWKYCCWPLALYWLTQSIVERSILRCRFLHNPQHHLWLIVDPLDSQYDDSCAVYSGVLCVPSAMFIVEDPKIVCSGIPYNNPTSFRLQSPCLNNVCLTS